MKKGAVTTFELFLLPVFTTLLIIMYYQVSSAITERVIVHSVEPIAKLQCEYSSLVTNTDYDRNDVSEMWGWNGTYKELREYYGLPIIKKQGNLRCIPERYSPW